MQPQLPANEENKGSTSSARLAAETSARISRPAVDISGTGKVTAEGGNKISPEKGKWYSPKWQRRVKPPLAHSNRRDAVDLGWFPSTHNPSRYETHKHLGPGQNKCPQFTHAQTQTLLVMGRDFSAGSDLVFIGLPGSRSNNNNLSLQSSFASLLRSLPFYASSCTLAHFHFHILPDFSVRGHACVRPRVDFFLLGNFTFVTFGRGPERISDPFRLK